MAELGEWAALGHEHKSIHPWRMQINHLALLHQLAGLLHECIDVLAKQSFILSSHLRAHARHNLFAPITVALPATRLLSDDVLGVTALVDALEVAVDLHNELTTVAQDQGPKHPCLLLLTLLLLLLLLLPSC